MSFVSYICVFIVSCVAIVLGLNICVCHLLSNKEISPQPTPERFPLGSHMPYHMVFPASTQCFFVCGMQTGPRWDNPSRFRMLPVQGPG